MLLVTGGAGFIGSNVVAALNEAGRTDIVVNDVLGTDQKWRNLAKRQVADVVAPADLFRWLDGRKLDAVIHMGAISDTTATDADLVMENNFRSLDAAAGLVHRRAACRSSTPRRPRPMATAPKASTTTGRPRALQKLKPMNLYGWSKQLFDQAVAERFVKKEKLPPQWAGLKFFNVFGPNEYHKGEMMSLVAKRFDDAKAGRTVRLFKSHRPGIGDGEQRRDFIYVDDAVAVVRWLMETPQVSGIFNVGTGKARSFRDLISALFRALGLEPKIEYVDMPENIRGQYQYFTEAKVDNLLRAGYNAGFTSLEDGVKRYVTQFLNTADRYR